MTIDLQVRKMINSNKNIICSAESYDGLKNQGENYINLLINGNWISYQPKSEKQLRKIQGYNHYRQQPYMK